MIDELDVVSVGVKHEGAVVAGVVHGTLARCAVVLVASPDERAVEVVDKRVSANVFAATCPDRTSALVLYNAIAKAGQDRGLSVGLHGGRSTRLS